MNRHPRDCPCYDCARRRDFVAENARRAIMRLKEVSWETYELAHPKQLDAEAPSR